MIIIINIIILSLIYFTYRTIFVFHTEAKWYEKAALVVLLGCESFIILHSVGYLMEIIRVLRKSEDEYVETEIKDPPLVGIIIPSYEESLDIIKNTLICCANLSYPNKKIVFLDDTQYDLPQNLNPEMLRYKKDLEDLCEEYEVDLFRHEWRGAKAGIINDFTAFCQGNAKIGRLVENNHIKNNRFKYLAVLDVDQNPIIDFLEPIIIKMEKNPKLAFVQTPQYYTNSLKNPIANASNIQQATFYEYICEGKSRLDAALCCGTNIVYLEKALNDVGGFDESSVTEDMATSLKFHEKKWKSAYFNRISCFGMGPENLFSYYTQQYRWSLGTLGILRKLIVLFFKKPNALRWSLWWEYFLSSSFYIIGIVFFTIALYPIMYNLFSFPSYSSTVGFNGILFITYLIFGFGAYILSIMRRGYSIKSIIMGQCLLLSSFPVFIKSLTNVILNRKGTFKITGKVGKQTMPLKGLSVQLIFMTLSIFSIVWGICRMYFIRTHFNTLLFNTIFSFYNFMIVFSMIFFNYPGNTNERG